MKRTLTLLTAFAASAATCSTLAPLALAQAAATTPAAAAPAAAPVAAPAKIALVNFEQVVFASNEGQTVSLATQKKYEPKKAELDRLSQEIETMKKGLTPNLPDDERASKLRAIDVKEKQLNRDAEDDQTAYNTELQEALGKVAQKLGAIMKSYAQTSGYTILLDVSSQSSNVLWALPSTDISQAVVDAYNKSSGIAAPPPPSPSPRASTPRPAGSTARPAGSTAKPAGSTPPKQ